MYFFNFIEYLIEKYEFNKEDILLRLIPCITFLNHERQGDIPFGVSYYLG